MEGEGLLVIGEEFGLASAAREVPEGEDGKENGEGALDDEEITPFVEAGIDMEDAVCEEAALVRVSRMVFYERRRDMDTHESIGNVGRCVEGGKPSC